MTTDGPAIAPRTAETMRDAVLRHPVGAGARDGAALRRHRLERLRASGGDRSAEPSQERLAHPAAGVPGRRAAALAADVGGYLSGTPAGPVVVVEQRMPMPADLRGLARLPEPPRLDGPLVCLDTETTGLGTAAGTLPFMVGLGIWEGTDFVVRQLVLPDHVDEPALLRLLEGWLPPEGCLVTYNGRSFDWPLLVARYRLHGRPAPILGGHLDLLPLARGIWRHRLPDARLASVEAAVAGVARRGDLPGALIPSRYLEYLRTRRGALLRDVLEHNRQDVVSLGLLLRVLAEELLPAVGGESTASSWPAPSDLGGLGRLYARRRRHAEALSCFDAALERLLGPGELARHEGIAAERARVLTRLGRRAEAEGAWHAIALEGGRLAARAWLHVAKHREHDAGDLHAALDATRRARSLAERARLFGHRDEVVERDLPRRVARLRRRLAERAPATGLGV